MIIAIKHQAEYFLKESMHKNTLNQKITKLHTNNKSCLNIILLATLRF